MIDVHPSVGNEALRRAAIESLASNRLDPKALYVTPRQAELWRQVFLKHSPVLGNPEFVRIYRQAFTRILDRFTAGKVLLVGLGCGTGAKEAELHASLKHRGQAAIFSAIDVSRDLVMDSVGKLEAAGAEHRRSLVCDLAESTSLGEWLSQQEPELPRLITFFGLVPNFSPSMVNHIFRAVLRPGDVLLVSAHLAPVRQEGPQELAKAMESVLPQYDNPETLAWLTAALEHWDLEDRVFPPEMDIGEVEGIPAFVAQARWKSAESFERWGHRFSPDVIKPLRLFSSLRYTPRFFEERLSREGFDFDLLAMTSCRQEAIWSVRRADGAIFQPPPT
jgi:SAM-dependent methyltransferase